ncbi:hypothetical protein FRC06_008441 [Ceratobasidium sp. 370]|nr:hypothetical protein FRC06_008441 [Ceratobasidium sp. 370]
MSTSRTNSIKTKVSGNKPPSEKVLGELSRHLTDTESTSPSEAAAATDIVVSPIYNVLLTFEHMHLVPRRSEQTVDELQPIHSETTTGEADAASAPNGLMSMRLSNAM